ncbi:hypothetical protein AJ80_09745 [Polytolypa hystricis UAMH7299]|uniref:Mediator of RNA polymerase II transcription subunit 13 n=1 Tax=Polytolypa hystricis (strain UAMH7299) TaxID=1447883 RepID=A0A2B7WKC0_POLH7|nr:hypothetical protein AJ80_09745 [Polytolypa hystricis UAMH7299]
MEFPAGALTSFHTIDGFVNLYWRLYISSTLSAPSSQSTTAENTILKCSNELKNCMLTLRSLGCLVSPVSNVFGLWVFSTSSNFDVLGPVYPEQGNLGNNAIVVGSTVFRNVASGVITAAECLKRLAFEPQASLLTTSAMQKQMSDNAFFTAIQRLTSYMSFYEAFISAVAAAIILHLTQQQKAIPLGNRVLFTSLDHNGNGSTTSVPSLGSQSTACLSMLETELTSKGRLLVSFKPISQYSIEQFASCHQSGSNVSIVSGDEKVWLAPNCTLCKFISMEDSETIGPVSKSTANENQPNFRKGQIQRARWKVAVVDCLQKFGLKVDNPDGESWVEVEVRRTPGRNSYNLPLQGDGIKSDASAPRRILWPARLCFKRITSPRQDVTDAIKYFSVEKDDPLQFAEHWINDASSRSQSLEGASGHEPEKQQKDSEKSPIKSEITDMPESLARTINYPDVQVANAVYPTPPGGILGSTIGVLVASEGPTSSTPNAFNSYQQNQNEIGYNENGTASAVFRSDNELVLPTVTPATDLGIGSGLYDTAGDEDLFGELDGENFDSKGITEADFNFFDDPDFADGNASFESNSGSQNILQGNFDSLPPPVPNTSGTSRVGTQQAGLLETPAPTAEAANHEGVTERVGVSPNVGVPEDDKSKMEIDQTSEVSTNVRRQPMSPPLSPVEIRKILFTDSSLATNYFNLPKSGPSNVTDVQHKHKHNHFEPVPFQRDIWSSDKKYTMDGRFWFMPERTKPVASYKLGAYPAAIPTIGLPSRGKKTGFGAMHGRSPGTPEDVVAENIEPSEIRSSDTSSDDSSQNSDSDYQSDSSSSPTWYTGTKRKRGIGEDGESTISSLEKPAPIPDVNDEGLGGDVSALLAIILYDSGSDLLPGYLSSQEDRINPVLAWREDTIQVAQLVVDQITQSSLQHCRNKIQRSGEDEWSSVLQYNPLDGEVMGEMARLDLKTYATLEEPQNTPPPRKDQAPPLRGPAGSIFKLCPPHVRVHRGNKFLEILPPAIGFWETFGLEPLRGEKDIMPFCLHPHGIAEAADAFLERLGLVYSSCNFGKHSRPSNLNGLIPWNANPSGERNYASIMHMLKLTCESLGSALSNLPSSNENIVIYIINPFPFETAIADISSAFLRLFNKYVGDTSRQSFRNLNELGLQIVPLPFVASSESLVVPTQTDYLRLALEVYSRCPPKDGSSDYLGSAPALTIAEPIPRIIPLKLSPDPVSPLEEIRCLHVAYSQSLDQRWVTAAWTDNAGQYQVNLSYCLFEGDLSARRPMSEIREDIWDATREIIEMSQSYWRVVLAKDGPVDPDEAEAWKSLVDTYNQRKTTQVEFTLVSIDTEPGLFFKLPTAQLQLSALGQQQQQQQQTASASGSGTTPVSTPRPSIPSPDPSSAAAAAATPPTDTQPVHSHLYSNPSLESDTDTILIDKSDETWALTLSHRPNTSLTRIPSLSPSLSPSSPPTYRPSLASGYLLRRSGTSDTDGLASLGVNIIRCPPRRIVDIVLKDVLRSYRDLATLARAKGIAHVQGDIKCLPWHIATAVKGQEVLSRIM